MNVEELIWRERNFAEEHLLEIKQLRITTDAIPRSPAIVPIAPERLRTMALYAVPDGVVADPEAQERWRELVVHPEDWAELLVTADPLIWSPGARPTYAWGMKIVRD